MAKKKKVRIRWKNVILALAVLALVIGLLVALIRAIFGKSSDQETYGKGLSRSALVKELSGKEYEGTSAAKEYLIYGEYMNFYTGSYDSGSDQTLGGNILLKDLCSDTVLQFNGEESDLNGQIDLRAVPEGFYEVYVVENLREKRVFMENAITASQAQANTFTTVARNGVREDIVLYADAGLFNEDNADKNVLDRNYVFLDVHKHETSTDSAETPLVYDIVLTPGPVWETADEDRLDPDLADGTQTSAVMTKFANAVKTKLETDGYSVLISQQEGNPLPMYGTSGLAAKVYGSKAKYMLTFDLYAVDSGAGSSVTHSHFVNDALATSIYNAMVHEGGTTGFYEDSSVLSSGSTDDGYDEDFDIREVGGEATGAGHAEGLSQQQNKAYASQKQGVEAVYISLFNRASQEQIDWFNANMDKLAAAVAHGLENYLNSAESHVVKTEAGTK